MLYGGYRIRALIAYLAIAIVLDLLGRPIVSFLGQRADIGKTYGAIITMLVILGFIAGFTVMFVPVLSEQGKDRALFDFEGMQGELDKIYDRISEFFGTSREVVEEAVMDSEIEKEVTEKAKDSAVTTLLDTLLGNNDPTQHRTDLGALYGLLHAQGP